PVIKIIEDTSSPESTNGSSPNDKHDFQPSEIEPNDEQDLQPSEIEPNDKQNLQSSEIEPNNKQNQLSVDDSYVSLDETEARLNRYAKAAGFSLR
ncbi:36251_t:CDS:2, partial [Racocetra persica]